uniref:Uncharacterized protein n=1 Tax=Panagrolaimus sp. ES5 TaxID=591445 RepID=A0AC34G4H4_9BILA
MGLTQAKIECAKEVYICSNHDSPDHFITVASFFIARVQQLPQLPRLPAQFQRPHREPAVRVPLIRDYEQSLNPNPRRTQGGCAPSIASNRSTSGTQNSTRASSHESSGSRSRSQATSRASMRNGSRSQSPPQPGINVTYNRSGRVQNAVKDAIAALRIPVGQRSNLEAFLESCHRIRPVDGSTQQLTAIQNLIAGIQPSDEFDQLIDGVDDMDTVLHRLFSRVLITR